MTSLWLIITQWLASGLGGYITGRLRIKWAGLHTHEVFFRDTANGFLSWAVASVVGAVFLASAASALVGGTANMVSGVASGTAAGASQGMTQAAGRPGAPAESTGYFVDSLFRTDHPGPNASAGDPRAEGGRILLNGLRNGDIPVGDQTYLAQLVAARTGLSQTDAEKRVVDDVIAQEKAAELKVRQAADAARKAAAYLSIFLALSMLIGAFIASMPAALGGRQRDEY
jgi:hypothetical protein